MDLLSCLLSHSLSYIKIEQFLLSNGDIVPIRQRGVKPVRQAYIDYTASKSAGL